MTTFALSQEKMYNLTQKNMTEMKKHYITPAMEVVNIETQSMLAGSFNEPEETQIEKIGATKSEMGWGDIW